MKQFAAFCGTAVAVLLVLFFCVTAVSAFAPAFSGDSGTAFGTGSEVQSANAATDAALNAQKSDAFWRRIVKIKNTGNSLFVEDARYVFSLC